MKPSTYIAVCESEVKNIDTKQSNKRNNQNSKSKWQDYYMKQGDTNDRTKLISMKTRGEIRCSGKVSISCFAWCHYFVSGNETYLWPRYVISQIIISNSLKRNFCFWWIIIWLWVFKPERQFFNIQSCTSFYHW